MHPEIIMYSLVLAGVILLIWRRRKKFKKGVIVANTKYVKKTGYFKYLNAKYHVYNILIKVTCILVILLFAVITARLYKTKKHEEEFDNRDIMLCMDFSPSVKGLNREIIKTMKKTVEKLKDERFGITIFNNAAITLVPLTTDYSYVLYMLDLMEKFVGISNESLYYRPSSSQTAQEKYLISIFYSGINALSGASLVGDGLASCANTFNDDVDRTKVIILSTDNMISGTQIITVPQAAAYAKKKGIKVYPIGTTSIKNRPKYRDGLVDVANTTGGVYFDFADYSVNEINKKIQELNKNSMVKTAYVTKKDLPELLVPYLLYLIPILFALDWRVRI